MRKIIFLVSLFVLISCANNTAKLDEKSIIDDTFSVKKYSTSSLVKEKFLEFYDLKLLLKSKPEFKESIDSRLANFKLDSDNILDLRDDSKISNIKTTEILINKSNDSDSIGVKLLFDIEEKNKTKKESVIGIVTKEDIIIDNKRIYSSKVKFRRFNSPEN